MGSDGEKTVRGLITNRIMSGMSMSGRIRSIAEVVSNINRPRGNWLGGDRCIYHVCVGGHMWCFGHIGHIPVILHEFLVGKLINRTIRID